MIHSLHNLERLLLDRLGNLPVSLRLGALFALPYAAMALILMATPDALRPFAGLLVVVIFVLGVGLALLAARTITQPLQQTTRMLQELSHGHLRTRLHLQRHDEIGVLAEALDHFADELQTVVWTMQQIALGDLSAQVSAKDDLDEISPALIDTIASLRGLERETKTLTQAAVQGGLTQRGNADLFQGSYHDIVQGINDTLDAVIGPLKTAADYVDCIAIGQMPPPIGDDYRGEFAALKRSLNHCIEQIGILVDEVGVVISAAREGRLGERAKADRTEGVYRQILQGLNDTLDAIVTPIGDTRQVLEGVGRGDLTVQMNGSYQGDFCLLKESLEAMVGGLKGSATYTQQSAVDITAATAEILASSNQMASITREQASAVNEISSTIAEIKASAEQVAQSAGGVVAEASRAVQVAHSGSAAARESLLGMDQIRGQVETIGQNIHALSEQTDKIGEIIDTVSDLAGQSNILALNAAIEAAQAGEAGRGFRVVADEVRRLAQQSRQAASQVRGILGDIQRATKQAVEAMGHGTEGVQAGTTKVSQTARTIDELKEVVEQSALAAQQILAGVEQQTIGLNQIVYGMEEINKSAKQSASGASQSQKAAQGLDQVAGQLKQVAAQYQL